MIGARAFLSVGSAIVVGSGWLIGSAFAASSAGASELDGVWARGDGNARVRIASCGAKICATNIWVKDTSQGEAVGDQLVMTVAKQPDGSLAGQAYDSKRGLNLSLTIRVAGRSFTSRGCVLGQFLCRDATWTAMK